MPTAGTPGSTVSTTTTTDATGAFSIAPFTGELDLSQPADLGAPVDQAGDDLAGADLAGVDSGATDLAAADLAPGPDMALPPPTPATFVQKGSYCQGTGSCVAYLPAASSPGDLLVISCGGASDTPPTLPNGWVQAVIDQPGTGATTSIWYYLDTFGGSTGINVSGGSASALSAVVSEWSGPTTLNVTGAKSAVQSQSATATTSAAASASLAISVFGVATGANPVTFTQGAWQNIANDSGVNTAWHVTTDYLLAPTLDQPVTADATANYSGAWYGVVATFR